jgi:hypothetical protein
VLPRRRLLCRLSRLVAIPALAGGCAAPSRPAPALGTQGVKVAAEAWHADLCLPAVLLAGGPLAGLTEGAQGAAAFAFGFGLESWMRAARPGSAEALGALAGGPAVVSMRALAGLVPPGAEEAVALRLPSGGAAAIAGFIAGQLAEPLPEAPLPGPPVLLRSSLPYSLGFTCNTWVMRALAVAGLPVPVAGIRLRGETMAALGVEAARQARNVMPSTQ